MFAIIKMIGINVLLNLLLLWATDDFKGYSRLFIVHYVSGPRMSLDSSNWLSRCIQPEKVNAAVTK